MVTLCPSACSSPNGSSICTNGGFRGGSATPSLLQLSSDPRRLQLKVVGLCLNPSRIWGTDCGLEKHALQLLSIPLQVVKGNGELTCNPGVLVR